MVALCFLAHNCAMGFVFGSFGGLVATMQSQFGIGRATAASAMSLLTLAMGVSSPFIGAVLQKSSIRLGQFAGLILCGLGFWGLALVPYFPAVLALYALIGVGVSTAAVIGPVTLISRWYDAGRGKALSVVMLPIFKFITPMIIGVSLPIFGHVAILGGMGTICLAAAALMLFIIDTPPNPVNSYSVNMEAANRDSLSDRSSDREISAGSLLKDPLFWLVSISIGLIAGAGTVFTVHAIPFGVEGTMSPERAALFFSAYAAAGVPGVLFMGWLIDRIGPIPAITANLVLQAFLWWGLSQFSGNSLFLMSALLGLSTTPIFALHGAAFSLLFGPANVSRAMGLSYSIKLPFIFFMAPLIGYLYERSRSYQMPFIYMAFALAIAAALSMLAVGIQRMRVVRNAPAAI